MPVVICAECLGQRKDSFHNKPIGVDRPPLTEKMKEYFRSMGINPDKILPTKWCTCRKK